MTGGAAVRSIFLTVILVSWLNGGWTNKLKHREPSPVFLVMLGRYFKENGVETAQSYRKIAEANGFGHFSLPESTWKELESVLTEKELWEINKKYLDIQIAQGKTFYFNIDPKDAKEGTFFYREKKHLEKYYNFSDAPNASGFYYAEVK